MTRTYPAPPSGLPQQQPQRYSDRHRLHGNPRSTFMPGSPHAAEQPHASGKPTYSGDSNDEGDTTPDTAPDIKSYLKKTPTTDKAHTSKSTDTRLVTPETEIEANELRRAKKPGPLPTKKADQ